MEDALKALIQERQNVHLVSQIPDPLQPRALEAALKALLQERLVPIPQIPSPQEAAFVHIGFWKSDLENTVDFPSPIEDSAQEDESATIAGLNAFLNKFATIIYFRGCSRCRICNAINGSGEYRFTHEGTCYAIPDGYFHYLRDHKVAIDPRIKLLISGNRKNAQTVPAVL